MPQKKPQKTVKSAAKPTIDRRKWLLAALDAVPQTGWTPEVWPKTAKKLGCDAALAEIVFPNGIKGLVEEFNLWADAAMEARITRDAGYPHMKVRQKIAFAVRARLETLAGREEALRRLLAWSAVPTNAVTALKGLYATVSTAWYAAGDTSTDYNFYTKRALLAGVVTATTLFWLNDDSAKKAATWAYLDSRIDDVMQIGQKIGQAKQFGSLAEKFMRYRQG